MRISRSFCRCNEALTSIILEKQVWYALADPGLILTAIEQQMSQERSQFHCLKCIITNLVPTAYAAINPAIVIRNTTGTPASSTHVEGQKRHPAPITSVTSCVAESFIGPVQGGSGGRKSSNIQKTIPRSHGYICDYPNFDVTLCKSKTQRFFFLYPRGVKYQATRILVCCICEPKRLNVCHFVS